MVAQAARLTKDDIPARVRSCLLAAGSLPGTIVPFAHPIRRRFQKGPR